MVSKHFKAVVTENREIAFNTYQMRLTVDERHMKFFRPGQFAHIEIPDSRDLLLRRPISVNDFDSAANMIQFAYTVMGEGTKRLQKVAGGDYLDILFPLGNGFKLEERHKKVVLIGGGIGNAPLLSVMTYYPDRQYFALLGFRSEHCVYQIEEFQKKADVRVTTDDGSFGVKGFSTDLLEDCIKRENPDVILACGPGVFFATLKAIVDRYNIKTYVNMEQHMGCGTGGCSVCVCKIAGENKRICVQGPVFDLSEVEL